MKSCSPIFTLLLMILFMNVADGKPQWSKKSEKAVIKRIDSMIAKRLKEAGFHPSLPADELVLLRRLSLDLTGVTPQPESVINYRRLKSKKKRNILIQKLINSSRFSEHMADQLIRSWIGWSRTRGYQSFRIWLVEQIQDGRPLDAIVRDIIDSQSKGYGPRLLESLSLGRPSTFASDSARAFMGLQIGCAECHDHPFSKWKQKQFHRYTAFFARGEHSFDVGGNFQSFEPRFPIKIGRGFDSKSKRLKSKRGQYTKRELVARWITHPRNPYFAKSTVNRLWKSFMGRGLVEPVDDLEQASGPHRPVLDLLAKYFVQTGFDLRALARVIVRLEAYQRSSIQAPTPDDPVIQRQEAQKSGDEDQIEEALARFQLSQSLYERASIRMLTPHQIVASILRASGIEPTYQVNARGSMGEQQSYEMLRRRMISQFEQLYDDKSPAPGIFEGSVRQKLVLFNDSFINSAMKAIKGSMLSIILREGRTDSERVRALYIATLARRPSEDEIKMCLRVVRRAGKKVEGFEDLMWALLNSSEFLMNH